jgi:hypothetical protein
VIPGDEVIVGAPLGSQVCIALPNKVGDSAGWVDARQIAPEPPPPAPRDAWLGHWRTFGGDTIDLKPKGSGLAVSGSACWPSCDTPPSQLRYGPNVGDLDGEGAPADGRLSLGADGDDTDCKADLWLVGAWLVVFDNGNCGGMNVRFEGVYQRARGR